MTDSTETGSVVLKEQVIEDLVTGITLTIWRTSAGEPRLRLTGELPHGNRDFQFDREGNLVGMGTAMGSHPAKLSIVR